MQIHPVWMRMPRETTQAYHAFSLYRDMGPTRSIAKAAEEGVGCKRRLERWSKKWKWVARSTDFDDYVDAERTKIFHDKRRSATEAQAELGGLMRERAKEGIVYLKPDQLAAHEICKLAETGVKIERLAYGDSTDNTSGSQELRFALAATPPWAAQQVKALDEDAAGRSVPAHPDARPLKASTILALDEAPSA